MHTQNQATRVRRTQRFALGTDNTATRIQVQPLLLYLYEALLSLAIPADNIMHTPAVVFPPRRRLIINTQHQHPYHKYASPKAPIYLSRSLCILPFFFSCLVAISPVQNGRLPKRMHDRRSPCDPRHSAPSRSARGSASPALGSALGFPALGPPACQGRPPCACTRDEATVWHSLVLP